VLLFLCKYPAFGSKQFKGLMHPHDKPQHLNFRGELYWVFITFQNIAQTFSSVLFVNHIFHFGYLKNSTLNMSKSDKWCFVKSATCHAVSPSAVCGDVANKGF